MVQVGRVSSRVGKEVLHRRPGRRWLRSFPFLLPFVSFRSVAIPPPTTPPIPHLPSLNPPLLEVLSRVEQGGHEEVEQGPQLLQPVLQRRACGWVWMGG